MNGAPRAGLRRVDVVLYYVALLLACACVVGGVLTVLEKDDRDKATADPGTSAPSAEEQDRYGEVLRAAEATATAMVNIDYRDPQASIDAVAATATGTFLDQYTASSDSLIELVTSFESVLTGEPVASAVSTVDADSATVLVATEGQVSNAQTAGETQGRNFRFLVTLVRQDDVWLANDLEFVG